MKSVKCPGCNKHTTTEYPNCISCGRKLPIPALIASPSIGVYAIRTERGAANFNGFLNMLVPVLLVIGAIAVVGWLVLGSDSSTKYPGDWRGYPGGAYDQIALALAKTNTLGCGEFYYKLAGGNSNALAKVYCTTDGANWDAYLVNFRDPDVLDVTVDDKPPVSTVGKQ